MVECGLKVFLRQLPRERYGMMGIQGWRIQVITIYGAPINGLTWVSMEVSN